MRTSRPSRPRRGGVRADADAGDAARWMHDHPRSGDPTLNRASRRSTATRTAYRHLPALRGRLRAGDHRASTTTSRRIRGDRDDVFSHGFICPKGSTLKQLHDDPDRVRTPLIKRDGVFVEATWDEAFAEVARRLTPIIERHGRDAVGVYLGNPSVHSLSAVLYVKPMIKALGTSNVFSASTVDQRPKEISSALMFGGPLIVPVPDVDRTDFLLMLGANPYASNGSLATAPDWPGRIEALRARGGRLVVVDPRRSRTAEEADEWIAIRPGSDPYLLAAMARTIIDEDLVDLGAVGEFVSGLDRLPAALAPYDAGLRGEPHGHRCRHDPPARPRPRHRPVGRGLRADRHDHRRVRNRGELARRRAQHPHGEPRPTGRCDVHDAGRGRPEHARRTTFRPAVPARRPSLTGARTRRDHGRGARRLPGRGDRGAGRRPAPGPRHRRRQPGAVAAQRGPARRRARAVSS